MPTIKLCKDHTTLVCSILLYVCFLIFSNAIGSALIFPLDRIFAIAFNLIGSFDHCLSLGMVRCVILALCASSTSFKEFNVKCSERMTLGTPCHGMISVFKIFLRYWQLFRLCRGKIQPSLKFVHHVLCSGPVSVESIACWQWIPACDGFYCSSVLVGTAGLGIIHKIANGVL